MFENLLFQQQVVNSLIQEIEENTLPQSLLFYGDSYSGKLTCALELARVLNCHSKGEWGCQCKSCKQSLSMQHPYTLLTGTRYSMQEIIQSSDLLVKEKTKSAQYIFTRNVRKLIKRFGEELWDKEDAKYKKAVTSLNNIEEIIYLLEPENPLPNDKKIESTANKITDECQKIFNELPKGNIPISQIRKISSWVRRSSGDSKKVVILERAELMQDSSRNALLKVLEEPPVDTYFILISEKKTTVLPTILSRVRAYQFKTRTSDEQSLVLSKLFNTPQDFNSIKDFFFSYSSNEDFGTDKTVDDFLDGVFSKTSSFSDTVNSKIDSDYFKRFLELLSLKLQSRFKEKDLDLTLNQLEIVNSKIRDIIKQHDFYNQNPMLLIEILFYEFKRII